MTPPALSLGADGGAVAGDARVAAAMAGVAVMAGVAAILRPRVKRHEASWRHGQWTGLMTRDVRLPADDDVVGDRQGIPPRLGVRAVTALAANGLGTRELATTDLATTDPATTDPGTDALETVGAAAITGAVAVVRAVAATLGRENAEAETTQR